MKKVKRKAFVKAILAKLYMVMYKLFYFKKIRSIKKCEVALKRAATDKEVDQIILKYEIVAYMKRYLNVNARSKFIPKDFKNDEESRKQVIGKFGTRMEELDITINENLELCTL